MAFTKEAEKERFAKMPKAGIIERTLYKWALRLDKKGRKLEQKRIDKAPPCSCGDPHCERNTAQGLFWS
tara:strand:+ start:5112 stop:5318 length:207 start_codon:yes stop_codon:yes gene_type:complete